MEFVYLKRAPKVAVSQPRLLLLLHGYGSNEADLFSFADDLPDDFFIISLRAPRSIQYGGFGWYDINFMDAEKFNNTEQAAESLQSIRSFIRQAIIRYDLNHDEVWLGGFSQGAILSYALVLQDPENIRRVICMSGYPAHDILGSLEDRDYGDLRFFISHGVEDGVIPVEWARQIKPILDEKGIHYTYKEYRSGHGVVPQNFQDMKAWMQENN
ncbi:MAG: alpha/beta fold hydrolase [Weeksellaceae bacterium]|nr:alpha/beta fold hydrolase [Weeksellaceae bacterium]